MSKEYKIAILERYRGTFQILMELLELEGESYSSEIDQLLTINENTIRNVRSRLKEAGLIIFDERIGEDNKTRNYLILTDKGKKIAELAKRIEELL